MAIARYDGFCACDECAEQTRRETVTADVDEIEYCEVVEGWVLEEHHEDCEECNGGM